MVPYRGGNIYAAPGMTGGPTLARALGILMETLKPKSGPPGPASYVAYARALDAAFKSRFDEMGDAGAESPDAASSTAKGTCAQ